MVVGYHHKEILMRLDQLRLATRLWLAMGAMILFLAIIVGSAATASNKSRVSYATTSAAMLERIKVANQWANLEDVNGVRSHAVVVSNDPAVASTFKAEIASSIGQIDALQQQLEGMGLSDNDRTQIKKIIDLRKKVMEIGGQSALLKVTGQPGELDALVEKQYRPAVQALQQAHQEFVTLQDQAYENDRKDFDARTRVIVLMSALGVAITIVAILIGTGFLIRSIRQPLLQANALAAGIAKGDLSQAIDTSRQDEFGDLMKSLAAMSESLGRMVQQVRQNTDSIATASAEIATGNNDLAQRTEQTSSNLQSTASSMSGLTQNVQISADNARQASTLAATASSVAQRGGDVVRQVVSTMQDINDSSRKIADIIGVIDGIAFQTNILALNAAVEAARAGEQGRGFAVVASEVRSLAGRSAEAAKEIKTLINTSVEKVASGTQLVSDAGITMNDIVQSVRKVADVIGEITAASGEQSAGISEINGAIGNLDQMTQQNAALVEQSAAAAESLRDQADQLARAVAVFKTSNLATTLQQRPMRDITPRPQQVAYQRPALLPSAKAKPALAARPAARQLGSSLKSAPYKAAAPVVGQRSALARPVAPKPAVPKAPTAPAGDSDWETF